MALAAMAIKIDSPGPVFYRQQRVGLFDRPFTLFKFRSMTLDAEAGGNPALGGTRRIRGSPGSGASSAPRGSTNCRNWSMCCAAT